ncbi:MAG: pilus assembly protein TadG-related protein [Rhodobacteraceae bacterium]|nr:pilus assembly protein TadG-related protein [Paracoccaceae bacterium]
MRLLKSKRYLDDEGGAISAFVLVMFLTMIVGGGMGIDFMYHESERAELQDALDRGVLASASFDIADYEGTTEAERDVFLTERVKSYLRSNSLLARRNPQINVVSSISERSRRISVTGSYDIDTFFLKLAGINSLNVSGAAVAAVTRNKVEISMILDNSGSMGGGRIISLRNAANNFVDLMLNDDTIDHTSISLVPFEAAVNVGPVLSSYYNLNQWHGYSQCFEFEDEDFETTSLLPTDSYEQAQNYMLWVAGIYECPRGSSILAFSNDPDDLHDAIDDMQAGGFTATWAGMKWGAALLDPTTQPVVTSMIGDGEVNPLFAGRPAAWDDELATKFIILMTDGQNTLHRVMDTDEDNYNVNETDPWNTQENADFWEGNLDAWRSDIDNDASINGAEGDDRLEDICNAAKQDDRIIVFTIGLEVAEDSNPFLRMRECASSLSRFYHVTDDELNTAFTQIGASINKLRLVD